MLLPESILILELYRSFFLFGHLRSDLNVCVEDERVKRLPAAHHSARRRMATDRDSTEISSPGA